MNLHVVRMKEQCVAIMDEAVCASHVGNGVLKAICLVYLRLVDKNELNSVLHNLYVGKLVCIFFSHNMRFPASPQGLLLSSWCNRVTK